MKWLLLLLPFAALGQNPIAFWSPPAVAAALTQPSFVRAGTNGSANASSVTISAFNCSGGNYLIVEVSEKNSIGRTISGITANGVAMTKLAETNLLAATGHQYIFGLASPATGDIVVSASGAITTGFSVGALLFNNVGSTGDIQQDEVTSLRASVSVSLSTVATDLCVDLLGYQQIANNFSAGASQTLRVIEEPGATLVSLRASTKPASAGSTTMSWSVDGTGAICSLSAIVLHGK